MKEIVVQMMQQVFVRGSDQSFKELHVSVNYEIGV